MLLSRSSAVLSQRGEYRFTYLARREQEIDVRNGDAWTKRDYRVHTQCRAEFDMAQRLQGLTIALLAADGVGQMELDASGGAVRKAGAQTQLLSLRTGHIESLNKDLEPGRTYTVDQTVAQATADEYEALLLVPGMLKSDELSGNTFVVSFVHDFITSGKPVGVVCQGAWTLVEAGVARGRRLPLYPTMRPLQQPGASTLEGDLVSPRELRAFYSTIVEELARLTWQPTPASVEETEHPWARLAVLPAQRRSEKWSGAKEVARS